MTLKPVRVFSYGSHPWQIQEIESGRFVDAPPMVIDHPISGRCLINGQRFFRLKRDAQKAIEEILKKIEKEA